MNYISQADDVFQILKKFKWDTLKSFFGGAHSSIIGFISSTWVNLDEKNNSVLDGAPSPIIGNGRKGQKNADILLCKEEEPFIVVEVETNVSKYGTKLDTITSYFDKDAYQGLELGIMVMTNLKSGDRKYKHNWDEIKQNVKGKKANVNVALVSIEKRKMERSESVLGKLKHRNDYYPWQIEQIDYWIYAKDGDIKEGQFL